MKLIFNNKFLFFVYVCCFCLYAQNPNQKAWQFLLDNKPLEAKIIFLKNCSLKDSQYKAETFRGLAQVSNFLGQEEDAAKYFLQSFMQDKNIMCLTAGLILAYPFCRTAYGSKISEGYKILQEISNKSSLFTGQFQDMLIERYINDGKLNDAMKLANKMGIIRKWMIIGPFENISNSGFNKEYPPEKEIILKNRYEGKNKNLTKWFEIQNTSPSGWIFTENYISSENSVVYYYTPIVSQQKQKVLLCFGASGAFKIFLNGICICKDSIYRNTGADNFIVPVILNKGNNHVLVKLCHEQAQTYGTNNQRLSNFLLRFLDTNFVCLNNISYTKESYTKEPYLTNFNSASKKEFFGSSPIFDSVYTYLLSRINKNDNDIDAILLLIEFFNSTERFDEAKLFIQKYLKKFPQSSILHGLYSECLLRAKKYTESQTEIKLAYNLCNLNYSAWESELNEIIQKIEPQKILNFILSSPPLFKNSLIALITSLSANSALGKNSEIFQIISDLEKKYSLYEEAVTVLYEMYINQGQINKAEKIIKKYLSCMRSSAPMYQNLANLAYEKGKIKYACRILNEGIKYSPNNPYFYYLISKYLYNCKDFKTAFYYVNKSLSIMPFDLDALKLKAEIANSLYITRQAILACSDIINFVGNNFEALESYRILNHQLPLDSVVNQPSIDSLINASANWQERNYENGAVLCFVKDVFVYQNKQSKERYFLLVYLGSNDAIDIWKEREINYYGNSQTLNISKAYTYKSNQLNIPADIQDNKVVFKSCEAGDCIVLEYTLKNYYTGTIAKNVFGSMDFDCEYPCFDMKLRIINETKDTIPYQIIGDSIKTYSIIDKYNIDDYKIIVFSRSKLKNVLNETFVPKLWQEKRKVNYSTFSSWSQISNWFYDLTVSKCQSTIEIKSLADSLFAFCKTPEEKVYKVHEYITNNIRYSYVPFRQSGWIPQNSYEVLASKIGDCKDMACLGKSLLDIANIKSYLVLVNTDIHDCTTNIPIGPDFNHCILSYSLNDQNHFVDFTSTNLPPNMLPRQDQNSVGLIIDPNNKDNNIFLLPQDFPDKRKRIRKIQAQLEENGIFQEKISTIRTGIFSEEFKNSYKNISYEKRKNLLQKSLSNSYSDICVDSIYIENLNSQSDSIYYFYHTTAKNTISFSGANAIFQLKIPDRIEAGDFPAEENRTLPIDMNRLWYSISNCELLCELTFPSKWKILSIPENFFIETNFGKYSIEFSLKDNVFFVKRKAIFNFNQNIPASQHKNLKDFLTKISKADEIYLIFSTKK